MNFKPTLLKSVVSLVVFILADLLLAKMSFSLLDCLSCPEVWSELIFDTGTILISLIIGLVVYMIWSLVQKRK